MEEKSEHHHKHNVHHDLLLPLRWVSGGRAHEESGSEEGSKVKGKQWIIWLRKVANPKETRFGKLEAVV